MQKLTSTLLLFFLLLTSVMSKAGTVITSISQIDENKVYTLKSAKGAFLYYDSSTSYLLGSLASSYTAPDEDATDENQQFRFIPTGTADTYYLYSVGAAKYVTSTTESTSKSATNYATYTDTNPWALTITTSTVATGDCLWYLQLGDYGVNSQSISDNSPYGLVVNSWTDQDAGNTYSIVEVETEPEAITTITRTGVTAGTWQSFCLPFNIDIDNLQAVFDKIYIPYNGEELIIYDDLDDATSLTKRRAVRKTSATVSTDDELRYTFGYSPAGSTSYQLYLADFTSMTQVVIPLEMSFFAHVRTDITIPDEGLTLTGHLFDDIQNECNIETSFPLYTDTSLQTQDEDRIIEVIGLLADPDDSYEDLTPLAIDPDDGTFSPIECTDMEQYHAYLMGTSATAIQIHPTALADLPYITSLTDYDLNADGLETIADAAYLISILNGADDTTGKADLNQDSTIDLTDLTILLNHILQR